MSTREKAKGFTLAKITKRLIDSTPCPTVGQTFLRDAEIPGFALRLTPGSKAFILEKRVQGRLRRMTLGSYGALTLDEARSKARIWIGEIEDGGDPAQERTDKKRESTFADLEKSYLEYQTPRKKSLRDEKAILNIYLPHWRNQKLSSITRKQITNLHTRIGARAPYRANRILALLSHMFNKAIDWGMLDGLNPATRIERFGEQKRDRFVQPDEFKKLMESISQEKNIFIQGALLVTLFTGARIGEVLSAKWEDINLSQGTWRIPHTKADRVHILPLPQTILAGLSELPRVKDNPYVFPGSREGAHLVYIRGAWREIRTRAGLPDVRIHDLRRTLGSWLAGSGASLPLIGKVLNHSQPSTTAVYARMNLDPVRAALDANAERMIQAAGGFPILKVDYDAEDID